MPFGRRTEREQANDGTVFDGAKRTRGQRYRESQVKSRDDRDYLETKTGQREAAYYRWVERRR